MGLSMRPTPPTEARSAAHGVVCALTTALQERDGYTSEHSSATVLLTQLVGARLGLDTDALDELAQIAALHDIGKLGIPTDIIRKPGPLTP
jgi:HD-GYP domain-containing protein (c-di-GMP phosphodiesterase class II)